MILSPEMSFSATFLDYIVGQTNEPGRGGLGRLHSPCNMCKTSSAYTLTSSLSLSSECRFPIWVNFSSFCMPLPLSYVAYTLQRLWSLFAHTMFNSHRVHKHDFMLVHIYADWSVQFLNTTHTHMHTNTHNTMHYYKHYNTL